MRKVIRGDLGSLTRELIDRDILDVKQDHRSINPLNREPIVNIYHRDQYDQCV